MSLRIYVDFDDVLCETAKALSALAHGLFGRDVPYERITFFNLQESFDLSEAEYDRLMVRAHTPEFLGGLEPTPGAVEGLQALVAAGDRVTVVTGRPTTAAAATEAWLKRRGLGRLRVRYVDKYHRAPAVPPPGFERMLTVAELDAMPFDVAIDDSPLALDLLRHRADCRVLIFDRPWNRAYAPGPGFRRVRSWAEILRALSR